MGMNIVKEGSNMYQGWLTHTWNTVKGKCPHDCHYCYMKKWGEQKPVRFTPSELKTDLGSGNTIFVGSSCDMWGGDIPSDWIVDTLNYCSKYKNEYLFQTKNPDRVLNFINSLPTNLIIGTTIESNKVYPEMGNSPTPILRALAMIELRLFKFKTMVTIEPVMDFDISQFVEMIRDIKPAWVNIGANTNTKVKLKEPDSDKLLKFIDQISEFTEIKKKSNLERLYR